MAPRLSFLPAILTYVFAVVAVLTNTTHHGTKRACSAIWDTAVVRFAFCSNFYTQTYHLDLSRSQRNCRPLILTVTLDIIEGT